MKRVAIVQARSGSTRLPGKVLMPIGDRPMLARIIERLHRCPDLDDIVVATTTDPSDDLVVRTAERSGARWSRGSPRDVLDRYLRAAREADADVIVRVTADCPLVDPSVVTRAVEALDVEPCDYASNVVERTFPRGLDVEAMHRDSLVRTARLARSDRAREHVTWFIYGERPDLWQIHSIKDPEDNSDLRWTVDTTEDLVLMRRLHEELEGTPTLLDYRALVRYVRAHPDLATLNAHIEQRSV